MVSSSCFTSRNVIALFVLLLAFLNITGASPHIQQPAPGNLVARTALITRGPQTHITQEQYETYLKEYFPTTDKYLLYTGSSENQVIDFKKKNKDYLYYHDLFNAYDKVTLDDNLNHAWYKFFGSSGLEDDAEAASRAMCAVATDKVHVFGGAEYKDPIAEHSFYRTDESKILLARLAGGKGLKEINHMAKGATSLDQIMIKEDGDGTFHWQPPHKAGEKNASGAYVKGSPPITPKSTPGNSPISPGSCRRRPT